MHLWTPRGVDKGAFTPVSLCNYMNDKIVGFRFPTVIPASSGHQRSFSLQIKL